MTFYTPLLRLAMDKKFNFSGFEAFEAYNQKK